MSGILIIVETISENGHALRLTIDHSVEIAKGKLGRSLARMIHDGSSRTHTDAKRVRDWLRRPRWLLKMVSSPTSLRLIMRSFYEVVGAVGILPLVPRRSSMNSTLQGNPTRCAVTDWGLEAIDTLERLGR